MANHNRAFINPQILTWARKRLFPTVEAASGPLKVPAERLEKWERGESCPTFTQARRMAARLRIPFGYLYLSSPPPEAPLPLPDFRFNPGAQPSIDLTEVIHDAQRKQEWYREEMLYDERPPLPFVGRFSIFDSPSKIATDISDTIGVNDISLWDSSSWSAFLTELVNRTEDCGILVLRSGVAENNNRRTLSVAEFRGFALVDPCAPMIFINARDSKTAQIFTLAHELAHIWVNKSGISNPDFRLNSNEQANQVERLCYSTASELLLQKEGSLWSWVNLEMENGASGEFPPGFNTESNTTPRQTLHIRNDIHWKQSNFKVARRLSNGKENRTYNTIISRNSRRFTSTIITAVLEERIGWIDTARLLNIKGRTIEPLAEYLLGGNS